MNSMRRDPRTPLLQGEARAEPGAVFENAYQPEAQVLKLRYWHGLALKGHNITAQGNALGWWNG